MRGCNGAPADKQSQFYCVKLSTQPLVGKDSAGVTKTLAESDRRQLHPSLLRREGLVRMWSSLWKGRRRDSKIFNIKEQDLCTIFKS